MVLSALSIIHYPFLTLFPSIFKNPHSFWSHTSNEGTTALLERLFFRYASIRSSATDVE